MTKNKKDERMNQKRRTFHVFHWKLKKKQDLKNRHSNSVVGNRRKCGKSDRFIEIIEEKKIAHREEIQRFFFVFSLA